MGNWNRNRWEENKDIECIFGFSQGALISIFLSILIHKGVLLDIFPNLKCIILVAAFFNPFPKNEELEFYLHNLKNSFTNPSLILPESKIKIPVLNVYGECDEYILPSISEKIQFIYENCENYMHKGKHFIPTSKADLEIFINFLKKYLKEGLIVSF